MTTITANSNMSAALKTGRTSWVWYVILGVALIAVGLLASINLFATTIVSVIYIAAMMLVGAVFQMPESAAKAVMTNVRGQRSLENCIHPPGAHFFIIVVAPANPASRGNRPPRQP